MSEPKQSTVAELALAQTAAESYLEWFISPPADFQREDALRLGNNNPAVFRQQFGNPDLDGKTRMTNAQIERFIQLYDVVDHLPNTWSGFSATLLRNKQSGEYVLSFRSTEYQDEARGGDWTRDGLAGANGEIRTYGFAVAQIADMEAYFRELRSNGLLPQGASFRVTGYSLGGHLATVFAEAHVDDAGFAGATTFNSPGRGSLANDDVRGLVNEAYETLSAANAVLRPGTAGSIYLQSFYYSEDGPVQLRRDILDAFGPPSGVSLSGTGLALANGKIDQVFGRADFDDSEWVANTGIHSDQYVRVFIEDQPAAQGFGISISWFDRVLGLKSDFGTTHSITLLTDSVAVGELVQAIDSTADLSRISAVLSASSNTRGSAALFTSGQAEFDSLERPVEALSELYGVDLTSVAPGGEIPAGRTGGSFGNLANRNAFFDAIGLVRTQVDASPGGQFATFNGVSASVLAGTARNNTDEGLAYRYALVEGNTFALAKDRAFYDSKSHTNDGRIDLYSLGGQLSDFYIDDRAGFIERKTYFNVQNARYDLYDRANPGSNGDRTATAYNGEAIVWDDRASGILIRRTRETDLTAYRQFGTSGNDALRGRNASDRLYGGAGTDLLEGGGSPDVLHGGRGADMLAGGLGNDTYVVLKGDGVETIFDLDSQGTIDYAGQSVTGVFGQVGDTDTFTNGSPFTLEFQGGASGGLLKITRADDTGSVIYVRNFHEGDLQIALNRNAPPPKTAQNGTSDADTLTSSAPYERVFGLGGDDRITLNTMQAEGWGGAGNDFIQNGGEGTQTLYGEAGRDILIASRGNDELYGGNEGDALQGGDDSDYLEGNEDSDFLAGGFGSDVLDGGDDDDHLFGDAPIVATDANWSISYLESGGSITPQPNASFQGVFAGNAGDADVLKGGTGNDHIFGEGGDDYLEGGAGADRLFGQAGNDYLDGGTEDDGLHGHEGSDILFGGDGADELFGDADGLSAGEQGDDLLSGDAGNDYLRGFGGDDVLQGGEGQDQLLGEAGDDFLEGGDGDDQLFGDSSGAPLAEQGADYLDGGAGNDFVEGFAGDDELFGGTGDDLLYADDGDDYADGEDGADQISGGEGSDVIFGGTGNDTILGDAGNDYVDGEDGNDLIAAGAGDDETYGSAGIDQLQGGDGNDYLDGGTEDDVLFGEAGADTLVGGEGNDQLQGGTGNDTLDGSQGNDSLAGGEGSDTLAGGAGADTYIYELGGGTDFISDDGGEGNTLSFGAGISHTAITLGLGSLRINVPGGGEIHIEGFDPDDPVASLVIEHFRFQTGADLSISNLLGLGIEIQGTPDADVLTGTNVNDRIYGLGADDVIHAKAGDDLLDSGEGDDLVFGGGGNDRLLSSAGADLLVGETGDDTYEVNDAAAAADDVFVELAGEGRDRVLATVSFDLAGREGIEDLHLAGADPIAGSGSDAANFILGNDAANALAGRGGDDFLRGARGDDELDGGAGDDTLMGDGGNDTYVLGIGADTDLISETPYVDVFASFGGRDALRLTAEVSESDVTFTRDYWNLYVALPGTSATVQDMFRVNPANGISGRIEIARFAGGTEWADAVFDQHISVTPATSGDDTIFAGGSGETLNGLAGNDTIYAFAGNDVLDGGAGNDLLSGGDGDDVYFFGRGSGADFVDDYDYAQRLIPLSGDANRFLGYDAGFSHSTGETDIVRMAADVRPSDVRVTRIGGNLVLTIKDTGDSLTLGGWAVDDPYETQHPGRIQFVEFADGSVWDKEGARTLVTVAPGTEGDDVLEGTDCPDVMEGRGGNDRLNGYFGADRIDGSTGNDILNGNEGNDRIAGGPGNDTIDGGVGADTYRFGIGDGQDIVSSAAGDTVELGSGIGPEELSFRSPSGVFLDVTVAPGDVMTIGEFFSQTAASNIAEVRLADGRYWETERIRQTVNTGGTGADTLVGTLLADTMRGNAGDDFLSSQAFYDGFGNPISDGDDVLDGGLGNDTLSGGNGLDTYLFGRGSGKDLLFGLDSSSDRVIMGPGISPQDVTASISSQGPFGISEVKLHVRGTSDVLTITQWNLGRPRVVFEDGTVWASSDDFRLRPAPASQLNGATEGSTGDDIILGSAEDEAIWTFEGADTLSGGAGSDTLAGGTGNDTYIFARGDGADRIDQSDANFILDFDRVRFGAGIAPSDVRVVQRGNDVFFLVGAGDSLAVTNWALGSGYQVEEIAFEDGTAWTPATVQSLIVLEATEGNDTLNGTAGDDVLLGLGGNDTLNGLGGNDLLDGGAGNDTLNGGDGNDTLIGGTGTDNLAGNAGGDTYRFGHGYGADTITEQDNATDFNRIEMTPDVLPAQVGVQSGGFPFGGITLTIPGSSDSLRLQSGSFLSPQVVDEVRFTSDGTVWSWATLQGRIGIPATDQSPWTPPPPPSNSVPVLVDPVADAAGLQGDFLRYQIPANAFAEADAGDSLTYSLGRADGTGLPQWLKFDAATRTLLGTPIYRDVGTVELRATATDRGGLSASDTFTVTVGDVNDAPFLIAPLPHVRVAPGAMLSYRVPANAFADVDAGDALTLSAALADGSVLPAWLSFDPATQAISGTPGETELGQFEVRVTATDLAGLAASDTFALLVASPPPDDNIPPTVANAVADQNAIENQSFSFEVAANTFADPDDTIATPEGDHFCLVWSATIRDGAALPGWLRFSTVSHTFFGRPGDADVGTVELVVTVTDSADHIASETFSLTVLGVNDAPLASPDSALVVEDTAFSASGNVLANDFDADAGEVLSVVAPGAFIGAYGTLDLAADGAFIYALDNANVQFLGADATASDSFGYAATDGEAASASALTVTIQGANDAPQAGGLLTDQHLIVGEALLYALPADEFNDVDAGDTLTLAVENASDGPLPAWLSFDASSRTLSGTPGTYDVGVLDVAVVATDTSGEYAVDLFWINVAEGGNDAPVVANAPTEHFVVAGSPFAFALPANTFADPDSGDTLVYSAVQFGGAPLPQWVTFDPATLEFSGAPQAEQIGSWPVSVTAVDTAGAAVTASFNLAVQSETGVGVVGDHDDNVLYGNVGNETLVGLKGDDALFGFAGNDQLHAGTGSNLLQGGDGADVLHGGTGHNLLDGGSGNDLIFSGSGGGLITGGQGDDVIRTGGGSNVIAFSRGDGQDTVWSDREGSTTLSLGGSISYADVRLRKSEHDLVVEMGGSDSVTFRNWYTGQGRTSLLNLQFITEAMQGFDDGSSDPLYGNRVNTFDFAGIAGAFDAASAADPWLSSWSLADALAQFHLWGSDTDALGGDLAYQYGLRRNFAGIGIGAAFEVLGASSFGSDAQTLRPFSGLQDGFVKLS